MGSYARLWNSWSNWKNLIGVQTNWTDGTVLKDYSGANTKRAYAWSLVQKASSKSPNNFSAAKDFIKSNHDLHKLILVGRKSKYKLEDFLKSNGFFIGWKIIDGNGNSHRLDELLKKYENTLTLDISKLLPDLSECNDAAADYAAKGDTFNFYTSKRQRAFR